MTIKCIILFLYIESEIKKVSHPDNIYFVYNLLLNVNNSHSKIFIYTIQYIFILHTLLILNTTQLNIKTKNDR